MGRTTVSAMNLTRNLQEFRFMGLNTPILGSSRKHRSGRIYAIDHVNNILIILTVDKGAASGAYLN